MSKTVIEMARESGADTMLHWDRLKLERFAALVRADERAKLAEQPAPVAQQEPSNLKRLEAIWRFAEVAHADEREAIMDEWWACVQSDLESGVKSLNERAAEKWKKEYPAIAGFAATIEARGNT